MFYLDEQTESLVLFFVAVFGVVAYSMNVILMLISLAGTKLHFHRKTETFLPSDSYPGVSIIKPLMGVDPLLEENLESHFTLKYPKYELLCCFPDDEDPAINLVHRMKDKYPDVDVKMFTGGKEGIVNPMVFNMAPGYDNVQYEYVWISTSRIKGSTDIINDMASKLQKPNVGLVHQMPYTTDMPGFAAVIEKIYFGAAMARFYPAFNFLGLCCCTGMSYMFKKALLDEVNGLNWYGKYLAEDFFLTTALHERGHKLVMSAYPAQQNAATTVNGFKDRMVRWMRLRLNMMPVVAGICEPFFGDVFPGGLFTGWSLYHLFGLNFYIFYPSHILMFMIIGYIQLRICQNGPLPFSKFKYVIGWLLREFLTTFIFLEAILKPRTIPWGKKIFRVTLGGHTSLVTDKAKD